MGHESWNLSVENKRTQLLRMAAVWRTERASYDAHWRELGEHTFTRRTRFFEGDRNRGDKRNQKIINETGTLAARTLRAGMFTGITSPARPWRRLTTADPDLARYAPVKDWLYLYNERLSLINRRTNFYNVAPTLFGDMGVFATGCMGAFPDEQDIYRFYSFPVGSYWLATNQRGVVDTFMREFQMTVRQLILEFGDPKAGPGERWKPFSATVRNLWDRGSYDIPINVTMVIHPNGAFDPRMREATFKAYAGSYFETGTAAGGITQADTLMHDTFLRETGYDLFPIFAPRWDVTGEDVYGTSCPGMDALGSIKELQSLMKKKAKGLQKQLDPALTGPTGLKTQKTSLLSGDVTYLDVREGMQGLRPIHETNFSHADVREDINSLERRINRTFYADMFMAITQMEGVQPRNERELVMRHEERLLELGPVLERTNDEFLDPLTRVETMYIMQHGLMPPPPKELAQSQLNVEYISMMAQAQKLVGIAGTERFLSFVGNLSGVWPDVKDKIDADYAIDDYGDRMGVAAPIMVSDEEVAAVREARAQAQQQQAQAQMVNTAADSAKSLSETDMSSDNALTRVLAGA